MPTNPTASALIFLRGLFIAAALLVGGRTALAARPAISEDRELKEINLSAWDCRDRAEGSAKTPDGLERNRLKNRSATNLAGLQFPQLDTASFLQKMAAFEAQTKGMHRKDLNAAQRQQLDPLEKQRVCFPGYRDLPYSGPPQTA